ncbi:ependymin-like [Solea senegalensis]|nr:ependymin-like [Solea senegalensis]
MRVLVLCVFLSLGCLAQRPQPCTSPSLLTGNLAVSTTDEKLLVYAKFTYDAVREHIRLTEFGYHNNKTFHLDLLFLFKQAVVYHIDDKTHTCIKFHLDTKFHPLAIPQNASLLAQVVLGSSSGPGQGVLVNSWVGGLMILGEQAKYLSTFTEFGCIPVSNMLHTNTSGWQVTSFFNIVIGLADPQRLIPPHFCEDARLEDKDPVTFFSFF